MEGPDPSITGWGEDIVIDEDYTVAESDEPVDFSGNYIRPTTEYALTGDRFVDLATFEQARILEQEWEKDFDERDFFAFTVRGRIYNPGGFDHPKIRGEAWFELAPEPHNPADHCAVAIDFRGRRIGYVHADYAKWLHAYVRAANIGGYRCRVPGFIQSAEGAWYAIQRFERLNHLSGYDRITDRIIAVWRAMDEDVRATVGRPSYSQNAAETYWQYRHVDPAIFPDAPDPSLYWPLWNQAEKVLRFEVADERREYKRKKREVKEAEEQLKRQRKREAREAARLSRAAEVLRLRATGLSAAKVAKEIGISEETARKIINGGRTGQAGYNEHAERTQSERLERCRRAIALQKSGLTRAQIAGEMGLSPSTIKILLHDARFCSDPERFPNRLRAARQAAAGSHSKAGDRDLRMLKLWGVENP